MRLSRSQEIYKEALTWLPGGVNSPVRAFKSVGGSPVVMAKGKGPRIWDADGNSYIDYVASWGPLILGHAHPEVVEAVCVAAENGTSFGALTEMEVKMAKQVVDAVPSMEMVRFVNSGTEATMSAIRLARGVTGRSKIVKFEGCYHGHVDYLLAKAGSGVLTFALPGTPGVPESFTAETLIARFNDLSSVEERFNKNRDQIAAVILEPIMCNAGVILPEPGFLEGLREITKENNALLIFDEVITGFRVAYGGAQELYGITPDLTCLGKIIGGGLPVGAYGGRRDLMEQVAPVGDVYQAGTLSGNPLAMAAGSKTLEILARPGTYQRLEELGAKAEVSIKGVLEKHGVKATLNRVGSVMCLFFTHSPVKSYQDALTSNTDLYAAYFWKMLENGVYLAPSQFEAAFISCVHGDQELEETVKAIERSIEALKKDKLL